MDMKQEIKPTLIISIVAAVAVVLAVVVWKMMAAPAADAQIPERQIGPQGRALAAPPPNMMPHGGNSAQGPMPPPGAGPMPPPGAGPMPPPGIGR